MPPLRSLPGRPAHPFIETEYEHQLEMIRPSTEPVAVPETPGGFELRRLRPGDEAAYMDLFRLAWDEELNLPETVKRALEGEFVVVEHRETGHLVSSCIAGQDSRPWLGWLVTDPSHTGRGLGTIVAASVTNALVAGGFEMPYLGTEDFRLAAISIYLGLGWRPHVYLDDMESRWRDIYRRLDRDFYPDDCVSA